VAGTKMRCYFEKHRYNRQDHAEEEEEPAVLFRSCMLAAV
jgi:hypothetical protein